MPAFETVLANLDATCTVLSSPRELLREVFQYSFREGLEPQEASIHGRLAELPQHLDLFPLDLLGRYLPSSFRVEIYVDRVRQVAERLGEHYLYVSQVVRIHEWAHAVVHVGQPHELPAGLFRANEDARRSALDEAGSLWGRILSDLHEQIAQLMSYHATERVRQRTFAGAPQAGNLARAFEKLCRLLPSAYRIDAIKEIDVKRVSDVFDMLKRGQLNPAGFVRALVL